MKQLQSFDPSNREHLSRQLVLIAQFGEHLISNSDSLTPESEKTFFEILAVLDSYAAELSRRLDGKPIDTTDVEQVRKSYLTALMLLKDMLESDPKLLDYSPNTSPARMSEVTLSFLTHAAFTLRQALAA
jgi:hypothetical protein